MTPEAILTTARNGLLLAALFGAGVAASSCATTTGCGSRAPLDLTQLTLEELLQLQIVPAGAPARRCNEERLT